jgi:hypothetical protein
MTDEQLSVYARNPKNELVYELAAALLAERAKEREIRAAKRKRQEVATKKLKAMTDEQLTIYASNPKYGLVYEVAVALLAEREQARKKYEASRATGRGGYRGRVKHKRRKGAAWDNNTGRKVAPWDDNVGPDAWRIHGA